MIKFISNFKTRLLFTFFLILFLLFYGFGYAIIHTFESSYLQSLDATLTTVLKDIKHDYSEHPETIDKTPDEVKEEFDVPILYAQLFRVDNDLRVINYATRSLDLKESTIDVAFQQRETVVRKHQPIAFALSSFSDAPHRKIRTATMLLDQQNDHALLIVCALPYEKHTPQIQELTFTLWVGFSVLLTMILVLTYALISKSFKTVLAVSQTAKRLSAQDTKSIIPKTSIAYEIDDLIDTFNTLLQELRHAYDQVKQFGQNASHELKTPLTIMKGEVEVGLRKERSPEEYRMILRNVAKEIVSLQEVIEKILFLSSNTSRDIQSHFEEVYVDEILLEALQEKTAFAHQKNVSLELEHIEPTTRSANATLLKIMFLNLIDNAIKYSPPQTCVHLFLSQAFFEIRDEGKGIAQEDLEHILKPFYRSSRTKDDVKGSGLGLALVKAIVDVHGLTIRIDSQKDRFTHIRISF